MTVDASLFGDDDPGSVASPASIPAEQADTIPEWQVHQIRKALDSRGLTTMEDRQRLVVQLAGREVKSLRELTWSEARAVAEGVAASSKTRDISAGSSWDQRDEDTWIDRL